MKNREMEEKIKQRFSTWPQTFCNLVLSDCGEQKRNSDNLDRKKENQMDKSSLRYCGSLDDNDRRYLGIWGVPGSKYCGVDDFFGRQSQY